MMEKVRVLVVDDSSFFRKRIRKELERTGDIEVVGEATNGQEAIDFAARLHPDLITMDVAMPLMDGITAVREIMRYRPTKILMLSALTSEGAHSTLEALEAGATDFMAKKDGLNFADRASDADSLSRRVIDIVGRGRSSARTAFGPAKRRPGPRSGQVRVRSALPASDLQLVAIGASTGGPVAIQRVLSQLPASFPVPVVVAVHMPAEFTATFAERLDTNSSIGVALAGDGDALVPGQVLIAPGGRQTLVERRGGQLRVRLKPGGSELYKPSIDMMFSSAANELGDAVLAVVLTGMGADGTRGAGELKRRGSSVWSQDEQSSVVFGMPHAVAKAGFSDRVLSLDEVGGALAALM